MTKDEHIEYWIKSSDNDYRTMQNLYKSKDYSWCLFMGHLVIEKLLKAYFVKTIDTVPPKTHNLLRLAEKAKLELTPEQKDDLILLTTFQLNTRYPDYKFEFYKKCTREYTEKNLKKIKRLRKWLKQQITEK